MHTQIHTHTRSQYSMWNDEIERERDNRNPTPKKMFAAHTHGSRLLFHAVDFFGAMCLCFDRLMEFFMCIKYIVRSIHSGETHDRGCLRLCSTCNIFYRNAGNTTHYERLYENKLNRFFTEEKHRKQNEKYQ